MRGGSTQKRVGDLRHTAGERRDQVLEAAVAEFALQGLHGTSTERIAKRAGISQPYIFRLFPSKKELFLAAVDRCFDRVQATFENAVQNMDSGSGDPAPHGPVVDRLHAMGHGYLQLLSERELLLFQMQAYAACSDDDVRRRVGDRWKKLMQLGADLSGAPPDQVTAFFAKGMLLNVLASTGQVPLHDPHEWARRSLGFA
jgi:AcrR family transcriptional regulator